MAAVAPAGSAPLIQDGWRWLQSCCCVTQKPRDEIAQWMLLDTNAHASPSCMQMLLCQCRSEERVPSGIEDVPQLAGLAGATLQRAPPDWPTKGSVQTLKWCRYDKEKRVADLQVFGGFGGPSNVGLWTEPVSLKWHCLINLARCCVRARALERSLALCTQLGPAHPRCSAMPQPLAPRAPNLLSIARCAELQLPVHLLRRLPPRRHPDPRQLLLRLPRAAVRARMVQGARRHHALQCGAARELGQRRVLGAQLLHVRRRLYRTSHRTRDLCHAACASLYRTLAL